MKVIVFAATKGGVGKTTLSYNMAFEMAKHGTVYLVDYDPQGSASRMFSLREDQGLIGDNPILLEDISGIGSLPRAIKRLKDLGYERDYMIVDTPGSSIAVIREAISVADCVLLPCQPSPLDILAQEAVADLVTEERKTNNAVFIINRTDARSDIGKEAMEKVAPLLPNAPIEIRDRVAYKRAAIKGLPASEENRKVLPEMNRLWLSISKIIGEKEDGKQNKTHRTHSQETHRDAGRS